MAQKRRVGRPSKLTPDVEKRLIDAIKAGNYFDTACRYAGIGTSTFYRWLEKGETAKSGEYREFWEKVTRAESEAEARMVAQWQAQIPQDWRAARDFLARRHPERWAPKEQLDMNHSGQVTQTHEGSIRITEQLITDTEFLATIQAAAQNRKTANPSRSDAGGVDSGKDERESVDETN